MVISIYAGKIVIHDMLALFTSTGGALVVVMALALVAHYEWERLHADEPDRGLRQFLSWGGRGLLGPVMVWLGFNSGWSAQLPPLWPEAALVRATAGSGFGAWIETLAGSWMVVGFYWTALTFGWMTAILATRLESRRELWRAMAIFGLLLAPVAWLLFRSCGAAGGGLAGLVLFWPVVHFNVPLLERPEPIPSYSRAIAKLKFGKYTDAEMALIQELEKCQDDYDGWMMLAELYAQQFHELPEADRTIRELCRQPGITGGRISLALHRLADWHLKLGDDPPAARQALEEISRSLPGTHFARMARQRWEQIPASRQEWLEQRQNKPIRMPALADQLDEPPAPVLSAADRDQAAALANQTVEKLRSDPDDVAAREKLARILAEQLGRTELAMDQLELLIAMPNQPESKVAEWLSGMAAWEIRYRQDGAAAKRILERLIREYPHTAQAFAAQRRLNLIEMEARVRPAKS
jgi:hypothetical protein